MEVAEDWRITWATWILAAEVIVEIGATWIRATETIYSDVHCLLSKSDPKGSKVDIGITKSQKVN